MKYRLAGATYRVIAEKLTEERAQAFAGEKGISIGRAMKRIKRVSTRTAWGEGCETEANTDRSLSGHSFLKE